MFKTQSGLAVAILAATCALAAPAAAQERVGYSQIAAGRLAEAETLLNKERAIFPDRPELMLNLAAVYARTGRAAQARALYVDVLDAPAVDLDLPSGDFTSSHDVARNGLATIGATLATR